MATIPKVQKAAVNFAVQADIGAGLRAQYQDVAHEPIPAGLTDLLARLERKERTERLDARLQRLRQGLNRN